MAFSKFNARVAQWPLIKQLQNKDALALGGTASSARSQTLTPRTDKADRVVQSVCPYCAVGCGQLIYVQDEKVIDIESHTYLLMKLEISYGSIREI